MQHSYRHYQMTRVIQIVCFVYIIIFSGCYQHS